MRFSETQKEILVDIMNTNDGVLLWETEERGELDDFAVGNLIEEKLITLEEVEGGYTMLSITDYAARTLKPEDFE